MNLKEKFIEIFKIIASILAFFSILFYIYIRFIVEKLPRDLPSKDYPLLSIILYTWLTLIYIFSLIILPLYFQYRKKQKEPHWIIGKFLKGIGKISLPFIWLYEYIRNYVRIITPVLDISVYLFKKREKSKIIIFIIFILPRFIASIFLLIDIIYFNRIYYFYYAILLTILPQIFLLYLAILQREINRIIELTAESGFGYLNQNIETLSIDELIKEKDGEKAVIRMFTEIYEDKCTPEEVEEIIDLTIKHHLMFNKIGKGYLIATLFHKIIMEENIIKTISLYLFLTGWGLALLLCILRYKI